MFRKQARSNPNNEIVATLADLHRRLLRVEEWLAERHNALQPTGRPPEAGEELADAVVVDLPDDTPKPYHPPVDASQSEQPVAACAEQVPPAGVMPPPTPAVPIAPSSSAAIQESPKRSLEMLIGMNWMAWAGAASVVLAAGFFVKLAYDQGWFGLLTPIGKCILAAVFGGLLLVGGEVARRRVGRAAAASLFGAGIATLYLTALATFRWFHLLSETGAFWLLLAVALLGFAITVHARLITTGVLATLGGYLAPVLLANASSFTGALLLYLSMLLIVTLVLSAWRERPFRVLRYVALCCHGVVGWLWAFSRGDSELAIGLIFLGMWWVLINGEALLAALRGRSALGNAIVSLSTTAWVTAIGYWLLGGAPAPDREWMGLFAVSLAALAAIPAALFGPGVTVLSHLPKRAVEKLTVALWAQTGVLLAAAIGFQFDEFGQTIGWLALGYACIEVGRKLPSRAVDVFGLVVGALALARVAFIDSHNTVLRGLFLQFHDIRITYWGLLALGAVATAYASALRFRVYGALHWAKLPIVVTGIGTLGWVVVCLTQTRDLAQTGSLLTAAFMLLASYHAGRRLRCFMYGGILLWMSVAKWLMVDVGPTRPMSFGQPMTSLPVFNTLFGLALLITAGFVGVAWISYRRAQTAPEAAKPYSLLRWQFHIISAAVFLLIALSHETSLVISRYEAAVESAWSPALLRTLWWTLLWATGGVALIFAAQRWRWIYVGRVAYVITLGSAALWLCGGTALPRVLHGVTQTTIVLNLQFLVGVLIAMMVAAAHWLVRSKAGSASLNKPTAVTAIAGLSLVAIGLWLGSLELDRFFAPEAGRVAHAAMARQTALSIYWGVYAIGLVALGFARRIAWTRYVGLGLLTATLGKVLIVDMSDVASAYRILSFLGVGLLLIVTSLAYAKVSRRLATSNPESSAT